MKLSLVFLSLSAYTGKSCAQEGEVPGIHFFKGTMKEAIAQAKSEKKLIFFDAYASWCGPCKYMDAYIFSRADIGDFFNNNFVCVRMDMEKGEGPELKKRYSSVDGYPSFLFLGSDGNVIKTLLGSRSGNTLVEEAKLALVN